MRFLLRSSSKPPLSISIFFVIVIILLVFTTARTDAEIRIESDDDPCAAHRTTPDLCPIRCFRADPVCGVNGVTYWCGCGEAACEGVKVGKKGYCEVGNGGSGPMSGQALLLVHIVWLIVVGFSVVFGLF